MQLCYVDTDGVIGPASTTVVTIQNVLLVFPLLWWYDLLSDFAVRLWRVSKGLCPSIDSMRAHYPGGALESLNDAVMQQ